MAAVVRAILINQTKNTNFRLCCTKFRNFASQNKQEKKEEIDFDKPIKYSTSPAATWKAESSFSGSEVEDVSPWYQPIVVSLSVAVFMIYFCVLREESDIDKNLDKPLFERVEGLEEVQLINVIRYYKDNQPNYDTGPMEKRLAEIRALKNVTKNS